MDKKIAQKLLEETRLSKKRTDKLENIDRAAIELFSHKGFANTSSKEIAERAQVAEGTIFRHYKTKENLLVHILLRFINVLVPIYSNELIKDVSSQNFDSLEQFIGFFIQNRLTFVKKNVSMFRVFIKEVVYDDALRHKLLYEYSKDVQTLFYGLFDSFRQKGIIKDISNEEMLERILKTVLIEFIWVFALTEEYKKMDEKQWIQKLTKQFIKGL